MYSIVPLSLFPFCKQNMYSSCQDPAKSSQNSSDKTHGGVSNVSSPLYFLATFSIKLMVASASLHLLHKDTEVVWMQKAWPSCLRMKHNTTPHDLARMCATHLWSRICKNLLQKRFCELSHRKKLEWWKE